MVRERHDGDAGGECRDSGGAPADNRGGDGGEVPAGGHVPAVGQGVGALDGWRDEFLYGPIVARARRQCRGLGGGGGTTHRPGTVAAAGRGAVSRAGRPAMVRGGGRRRSDRSRSRAGHRRVPESRADDAYRYGLHGALRTATGTATCAVIGGSARHTASWATGGPGRDVVRCRDRTCQGGAGPPGEHGQWVPGGSYGADHRRESEGSDGPDCRREPEGARGPGRRREVPGRC